MAVILCLETSTTNCSVSIAKNGEVVVAREHNDVNYSHSENLHKFIKEALKDASFLLSDINAIAVSMGPGSYTGLRIGVSAAKGLCYALDVPLISISTLQALACQVKTDSGYIIPILDARRMEVYSAVFDRHHQEFRRIKAEIIDDNSFQEFISKDKTYLIGPGAEKCKTVLNHPNIIFLDDILMPSSKEMAYLAEEKYRTGDFEDVAYFEPYYLKDFIAGKKKEKA